MPNVERRAQWRAWFADALVLAFLVAQCLDGIFTYVGVVTYGLTIEANPIVAGLMAEFGHATGLAGAKVVAGALGIGLHLYQVHLAVAILTAFYLAVAVAPWAMLLFF